MEKIGVNTSIISQATFHTSQTAESISVIFGVHSTTKTVTSNRISRLTNLKSETLFNNIGNLCDTLYKEGYIILNTNFDWKVNRGIEEVSRTNGFRNFLSFIENRNQFIKSLYKDQDTVIRDLGPGDGNFIGQLENKLQSENYIIYGVGDRIYIDLYTSIKESFFGKSIPENIIKLFVKKFLDLRASTEVAHDSFSDIITEICKNIELHENDILFQDSMFSEETTMFSRNEGFGLDKTSREFLKSNLGKNQINELKKSLKKIILGNIDNGLQKIFISNFDNFRKNTIYTEGAKEINKSHIQFATRSTSHLNNQDYFDFLDEYIEYLAYDGSIFVDNGIQMSYTMITRLEELKKLKEKYGDKISINLVYDENQNNFASAIIEKRPFGEDIKQELALGFRLVSLEEATGDLFFQIDYIVRDYVGSILGEIYNDYVIFADINQDINQLVEDCCKNYVYLEYTRSNILYVLEKIFHKFIAIIETASRKDTNETLTLIEQYHRAREMAIGGLIETCENIYKCEGKDVFTSSIAKNSINTLRIKDLQQELMILQLKTESRLGNILKRINTTGEAPVRDTFATKNLLSHVLPLIEMLSEEKDNISSEKIRNLLSLALQEKEKLANNNKTDTPRENIENEEGNLTEVKDKFWSDAHILIAEDQVAIWRAVKAGLEKILNCNPDNISVVENGIEAVEIIRLYPNKFDVVLMDIQMPLKDGKQATEDIRKKLDNNTKIIAFTAEDTTREELLDVGFNDYLEKPCPIEELKVKIEKVCEVCEIKKES